MAGKGFTFVLIFVIALHACVAKPWEKQSKRNLLREFQRSIYDCERLYSDCSTSEYCREGKGCGLQFTCLDNQCVVSLENSLWYHKREYPRQ